MLWSAVASVLSLLVELVTRRVPSSDQALEIALLRYQLRVLERKLGHQPRLNRWDKWVVAVLFQQLKRRTQQPIARLKQSLLFTPQTVLKWHRELVQRKWTFQEKRRAGRPRLPDDVRQLVLRLANENSTWGYGKIVGELLKLGYDIDRATVRNILKRAGIVPAPERQRSLNWRTFLTHYRYQILACDFFTVETLGLKTLW